KRAARQKITHQKSAEAVSLPGVSSQNNAERGTRNSEEGSSHKENLLPHSELRTPSSENTASYTVLNEAYPLKHRQPSPVDSKYAVKRRGNSGLWADR